jgi:carbon monoxide dehydrogenase subunit G
MTRAFAATETIAAAPERVWSVLTDWNRGPQWLPGVDSMRAPSPLVVGSLVTFVARGTERSSTVTELQAPRRITLTSTQGPVTAHYSYTLEPASDGTRLQLVAEVLVRGPLRLLAPVIRRSIAKEDSAQPARLKALVETNVPTS